jgi:hypothetical protein
MTKTSHWKQRYYNHRQRAKREAIPFELSFTEWQQLWSPYCDPQGHRTGNYVMARHQDQGPYNADNVRITHNIQNSAERRGTGRKQKSSLYVPPLIFKQFWDL